MFDGLDQLEDSDMLQAGHDTNFCEGKHTGDGCSSLDWNLGGSVACSLRGS